MEPLQRVTSDFNKRNYTHIPCYYNKHNAKDVGTSWSCAMQGTAIATGKYGALKLDLDGQRVGWQRDEETGKLFAVPDAEVFYGTQQGVVDAAPVSPTPTPVDQLSSIEGITLVP